MRGAGHGYLLHPSRASRPSRQAADVTDSPWACHQQRAHRMGSETVHGAEAIPRGVPERERAVELKIPRVARKPFLSPVSHALWKYPILPPRAKKRTRDTEDTLLCHPESSHNLCHLVMVSTIRVENACPDGIGTNSPNGPSKRMCLTQTDTRPRNVFLTLGCQHAPALWRIWLRCRIFRAKGATDWMHSSTMSRNLLISIIGMSEKPAVRQELISVGLPLLM